tara:strand:- start:345 stop:650 length:306 start_codon:yes stop_codon:yes gene_type:complete
MKKASHIILGKEAVTILEEMDSEDCKTIDQVEEVLEDKGYGLDFTYEIKPLSDFTTEAEEKAFIAGLTNSYICSVEGYDEYMYLYCDTEIDVREVGGIPVE